MHLYQILSKELAVSKQEISSYALSAPKKYKVYAIPKRTSGKRIIAHPAKKLKEYQRVLINSLENSLPVHDVAFAYKKCTGIKQNAMQHLGSKYILKMDFLNFFNSITPHLLFTVIAQLKIDLNNEDCYLLTQLLFWSPSKRSEGKLVLSVGAPSSPLISNAVMFFFDEALYDLCTKKEITYTRYADDITFSTRNKHSLFEIPDVVKALLNEYFNSQITINESKSVFSSKAHNRHVTGIVLTNDNSLSVGRKRKRYVSSLIHKYSLNQLSKEEIEYLQGLFAFVCNIEPLFKARMINKYSLETVNEIVKAIKVTR